MAERTKASVTDAVRTLFALGDEFDLAGLKEDAANLRATDPFERLAIDRAAAASEEALRRIAVEVLKNGKGGIAEWIAHKGMPWRAPNARCAICARASSTRRS